MANLAANRQIYEHKINPRGKIGSFERVHYFAGIEGADGAKPPSSEGIEANRSGKFQMRFETVAFAADLSLARIKRQYFIQIIG